MGRRRTRHKHLPPRMLAQYDHGPGSTLRFLYDAGTQEVNGEQKRVRINLGTDETEAWIKYAHLERDSKPLTNIVTFGALADRYLREVSPTKAKGTFKQHRREVPLLKQFFGEDAPLDKIEPIHIEQYFGWRNKPGANREIALFSAMWKQARGWGYTKLANPSSGIKRIKEKGRDVYVEDDLYGRVWSSADIPTREVMDGCYLSGQRVGDVLKMQLRDIKDGVIEVTQNKTGTKRKIIVEGELLALVERIKERRRDLPVTSLALFVNERGAGWIYNTFNKRFVKAREDAGVDAESFQLRDLRAKAATDKEASTGSSREAQKQLGHSTIAMTEHYLRNRRGDRVKPTK